LNLSAYAQSGIVVALLLGVGWLFIAQRNKSGKNQSMSHTLRWTGIGIMTMAIFLIVVGVLQYFDGVSHSRGH
jgi:uncharacterized membrane protein